jgi:hypothetical protein
MSRQRRTARAAAFLVVVVFLLAGAASWISVRAVRGEVGNRASVVQLCEAGNEARAQQITLWTHLIGMTAPPPHQTAAQHRQRAALIASFLAFVRKSFAPRDCTGRFSG